MNEDILDVKQDSEQDNKGRTYDAFISYRHKELDSKVASISLSFLESYSLPKQLTEKGLTGLKRVFRDTEELAVSRILSDTITEALHDSRFLIAICTTDMPDSEWCDKEVSTFIGLGRSQQVYALLVNGDEDRSFLPSLKRIPDISDRLLDVRVTGTSPSDKKAYEKKLIANIRRELLRVVAEKAGILYESLAALDAQRRRRAMALRFTAISSSFAAAIVIAAGLWAAAGSYRDTARAEQSASMDMLYSLTYTLPVDLADLPGTQHLISETLEQNVTDIDAILSMAKNPASVTQQKAENLMKLAGVYDTLGDSEKAISSARAAAGLLKPVSEAGTGEAATLYAKSLTELGSRLSEAGSFDEASQALAEAVRVQCSAIAASDILNTDNPDTKASLNLTVCYQNQAADLSRTGKYDEAVDILLSCADYIMKLPADVRLEPVKASYMSTCQNLGTDYALMAQYEDATKWIYEQADVARELYEDNASRSNLMKLADACASLANTANLAGNSSLADEYFAEAIGYYMTLASDTDNAAAAEALATAYANYGSSLNVSGDYTGADEYYNKALSIREDSSKSTGPVTEALIARTYYNIAENYLDMGDMDAARKAYDTCLEKYGPVSEALGDYHRSEYMARLSYYNLIFKRDPAQAQKTAEEAVAKMPISSFAHYMLAYAMLYNDDANAAAEFELLTSRGQNEINNIKEDLTMQERIGLTSSLTKDVRRLLS
ncbi:MAG: TIR domain-containing protein [Clostridiales Family XIII bacterium]|jgi:tetratricopeptide (TPR) repeat protein|nr:TIR domain-containing protein [Clostridiales Family XIII bacterium]